MVHGSETLLKVILTSWLFVFIYNISYFTHFELHDISCQCSSFVTKNISYLPKFFIKILRVYFATLASFGRNHLIV